MTMLRVSICSILLLVAVADSAKECFQCYGGTAECAEMKKVQCSTDNAMVTAVRMSPIYPDAVALAPESSNFYCAEASYSVFVEGENPNLPQIPDWPDFPANTQLMFKVKGCIFEPTGNICEKSVQANGQFSCRYCSSDNCNSALTFGSSLLVLMGCLMLTRLFSN